MTQAFKDFFDPKEIKAAWQLINKATSFVLLGHQDPDRDTIFACFAMAELLHSLGKNRVQIIFPNKPNMRLPKTNAKVSYGKHAQTPDLIMTFDCPVYNRLYFPQEFMNIKVINVDHHLDNKINGVHSFVDTQACSACEVLARLMLAWQPSLLTPSLSQLLLIGILDDSFVFKTQQSGVSALDTALKLIAAGADFNKAKAIVANHKTPDVAQLWAALMAQGKLLANGKLFVIALDHKACSSHDIESSMLDGLVNFAANLITCDVVALLRETTPNSIRGSMRAKKSDVKKIAATFGGGGHKYAAGFTAQGKIMEVTKTIEAILVS